MTIEDIPENNFTENNLINKNNPINKKNLINKNIINQPQKKNQIDYDSILKNMGMREVKGKLFLEKNQTETNDNFVPYEPEHRRKNSNTQKQPFNTKSSSQSAHQLPNPAYQNSYIYNKYFKNELKEQEKIQKPRNIIEYRNMLIKRIIEKKKVEQIKSKQMIFR